MTEEKKSKKPKIQKDTIHRKKGKKFFASNQKIDKNKLYTGKEAIKLLKEISYTKFPGTCEIHIKLNADPKQADQCVRSTVVLPHGSGKKIRVAAFVPDEIADKAKVAGADRAGLSELIAEVSKGKFDFDVAVAVPEVMKDIAKVAKFLGQKGLMPNPKAGTVNADYAQTIKEIKLGKIEFRNDKSGIIHSIFGKTDFSEEKLIENFETLVKAIIEAKPSGIKNTFFDSFTITATMSPAIKIDTKKLLA